MALRVKANTSAEVLMSVMAKAEMVIVDGWVVKDRDGIRRKATEAELSGCTWIHKVAAPHAGAVVVARFKGTGRIWPEGDHVRSGRVIKSGSAGGWLVRIFRPIDEWNALEQSWCRSNVITCADDELEVVR